MTESLNGDAVGWNWIRPRPGNKTWVTRKEHGLCAHLVSGTMEHEFDRHKSFKNQVGITRFSQYMYNETCPFAEYLWDVRYYGNMRETAHVYYVTAVSNDNNYVTRLLNILDDDYDKKLITLVIVVMDMHSKPIIEKNMEQFKLDVIIVDVGPPFSRSLGLRTGFCKAMEVARERGHYDNAIGFSIDTSVMVPPDFSARIRRNTMCSISVYIPVVYKCLSCVGGDIRDQTDGYWAYTGFGMIGMCFNDYNAIGGWSSAWGYTWGGEDIDMMERAAHHMPIVLRPKEADFVYARDTPAKKENTNYSPKRNLFPRALPPSSLTIRLANLGLGKRIMNFAKSKVPAWQNKNLQVDKLTRTYLQDSKRLFYHVHMSETRRRHHKHWVIVHSHMSPVL